MPRSQKRAIRKREDVPSAERRPKSAITFDPQARPVDPYDGGASGYSPGTAGLLGALQGVQSIASNAQPLAELYGGERARAGAEARAQGQERDPNAGNAFLVGYDKLDGEYKGAKHREAMKLWAQENSHLPPDEFNAGLEAKEQEFIDTLATDRQLDAAAPYLLAGNTDASNVYGEAKHKQIMADRTAKATSLIKDDINNTITGNLATRGTDMRAFRSDNAIRAELRADNSFQARLAQDMHKTYRARVAQWKALGFTQDQISAMWLDEAGRMATELGMPELLAYARIADESGIAVEDKYSKEAAAYEHNAISANESIQKTNRQEEEFQLAKRREKNATTGLVAISTAKTPEQFAQIRANILESAKNGELGTEQAEGLLKMVEERSALGGLPKNSDEQTVRKLEEKRVTGKLTLADLQAASLKLDHEDFRFFANDIEQRLTKLEDGKKSASVKTTDRLITKGLDSVVARIYPSYLSDQAKGAVDVAKQDRVFQAQSRFLKTVRFLEEKYGGRENIPLDEIIRAEDDAYKTYVTADAKADAATTDVEPVPRAETYDPRKDFRPPAEEIAPPDVIDEDDETDAAEAAPETVAESEGATPGFSETNVPPETTGTGGTAVPSQPLKNFSEAGSRLGRNIEGMIFDPPTPETKDNVEGTIGAGEGNQVPEELDAAGNLIKRELARPPRNIVPTPEEVLE